MTNKILAMDFGVNPPIIISPPPDPKAQPETTYIGIDENLAPWKRWHIMSDEVCDISDYLRGTTQEITSALQKILDDAK